MIQHNFNVLSSAHNDENFYRTRDLRRTWRHRIENNNQIGPVCIAKGQLKNCINQHFERIENGYQNLKRRNVVASRPKANQPPPDFLDAKKKLSICEA